jgi:hypothetical protein
VISSSLACKYYTRVEVTDSASNVAYYDIAKITVVKNVIVQATRDNPIKHLLNNM